METSLQQKSWPQPRLIRAMSPFERLIEQRDLVLQRLVSRRKDLEIYLILMSTFRSSNISTCSEFQRRFNGLYMVRRNAAWRTKYYGLFERSKSRASVPFGQILHELYLDTGRIEASFVSKMLATIDPEMPVYDSVVRKNLGLPVRTASADKRIGELINDYDHIRHEFAAMIATGDFRQLSNELLELLPSLRTVTDIKRLDFLFWQMR